MFIPRGSCCAQVRASSSEWAQRAKVSALLYVSFKQASLCPPMTILRGDGDMLIVGDNIKEPDISATVRTRTKKIHKR